MNTILMIAAFAVIAAVIYTFTSVVLKRMEARYERRSTEFRRKQRG